MSSWVDSGLEAASWTRAPPAVSSRTRPAVSGVTCRQAATVSPANGCWSAKATASPASTGMVRRAQSIRGWPTAASPGSSTSDGVSDNIGRRL